MNEAPMAMPATAGAVEFPRLLKREARNLTLQELADSYMAQYTGRDRSRPRVLATWLALLGGDRLAHEIDADDIVHALDHLGSTPARRYVGGCRPNGKVKNLADKSGQPKYRQGPTLNRYRAALGALFTYAAKRRLMPKGWAKPINRDDVPAYRENKGRTNYLTREQVDRLLGVCRTAPWERLWLLVAMAVTTGARRGELMALRWADIDLEAGTAHIRATKNGDERTLVFVDSVKAELARLPRPKPIPGRPNEHLEELLFRGRLNPTRPMNFDKSWELALRDAGIIGCRFHDLRHTCASHAAMGGASDVELSNLLGHRQMAMVKRYSHLNTQAKHRLVTKVFGDVGSK